MNEKEKIIELVQGSRIDKYGITKEARNLAELLISNGIGDITAEKHSREVAENALLDACAEIRDCPQCCFGSNKYCKCGYNDETDECETSKTYLCWAEYYKQQAENRLRGKV